MLNRQPHPPPAPYHGMAVTEADYWQYYYDSNEPTFEWNDGILEEKGVSDWETARLFFWFFRLLSAYLETYPRADLVMLEMGFVCQLSGKKTIRRPDIGMVLRDNPTPLQDLDRSYRGVFDLCLEGLSDSDTTVKENDTVVKRQEYERAGVKEYYILYRKLKECAFYRLNRRGVYVPLKPGRGGVICSQVLPGFQWRQAELQSQPTLLELASHPVYKDYVWTALSEARAQGEQAKRHAAMETALRVKAEHLLATTEQARLAAEQRAANAEQRMANEAVLRQVAEQRAARYAERLRELGQDLDAS